MKLSVSRVVAFATPIFAAGAGLLTPYLVKLGFHVDSTQVTALALAGATSATAAALKWLHGNSLYEREYAQIDHYYQLHVEHAADTAAKAMEAADPGVVQDVESQATAVADAARAKIVEAISSLAPAPAPVPAPAPAPVVAIVPADPAPPAA